MTPPFHFCYLCRFNPTKSLNSHGFTMNYQQIKDWMENYEIWD